MTVTRRAFQALEWQLHQGNPLIRPPGHSPILADPTFVVPGESPDGRLHLFAHALQGIFHYISDDGVHFTKARRLFGHAMRPFLLRHEGRFYLFYERIRRFHLYLGWLPIRWRSHIEVRESVDLIRWSAPTVVLRPHLSWHIHPRFGESVSNPCVLPVQDGFVLYYSANLVHLDDCGFNEPQFFGMARARHVLGPYESLPEPILRPDVEDPWTNMGCGSIKVHAASDGYVGLMNGIYRNPKTQRTGSAILAVESVDGVRWRRSRDNPVLEPQGDGWMQSHVYAFDFREDPAAGLWRLYFNARSDWHWSKGKEALGLMTAPARV